MALLNKKYGLKNKSQVSQSFSFVADSVEDLTEDEKESHIKCLSMAFFIQGSVTKMDLWDSLLEVLPAVCCSLCPISVEQTQ